MILLEFCACTCFRIFLLCPLILVSHRLLIRQLHQLVGPVKSCEHIAGDADDQAPLRSLVQVHGGDTELFLVLAGQAVGRRPRPGRLRPPSFQLIFQILPDATLHQLLPESRFLNLFKLLNLSCQYLFKV